MKIEYILLISTLLLAIILFALLIVSNLRHKKKPQPKMMNEEMNKIKEQISNQ